MSKKKDPNLPVVGDDEGNLLKAGYSPKDFKTAQKHLDKLTNDHPSEYTDTTLSQFIYEQAALAYLVNTELALLRQKEEVEKNK